MRQRVISSLVGLLILAGVLALINTPVYNCFIMWLSLTALYEVLRATGCLKNRWLSAFSFVLAVAVSFDAAGLFRLWEPRWFLLVVIAFFAVTVADYGGAGVTQAGMSLMFGLAIPLFFNCGVYIRDTHGAVIGAFYLLMALGSAWLCDTGAYFTGSRYGKRKLAPVISPNKTVEGAIGGLVFAVVFNQLLALGFAIITGARVNYPLLALFTPVWAALGMLGDLSASVIKRQFGAKDYGNIMPGHGGVMDRFDSAMFTLPAVYLVTSHIALVALI